MSTHGSSCQAVAFSATSSEAVATAATDSLHGHHKAAIVLNNTAVSLLVRGQSRYAMETFNDAMKFMRMVTVHNEAPSPHPTSECLEDVHRALDRASKRSASCSVGGVPVIPPNMPLLQVVSTQYNPSSIYESLASCAQCVSLPVVFPMTIDPIDYETCDDSEIGFHAGVVLYNYGIAHDCVAATATGANATHVQHVVQTKAHRIFQLTSALLSKVDPTEEAVPSLLGSRILLLQTFLTHNLIQASLKLHLQFEYTEYCIAMESLLQLLGMQQVLLPIADHKIAGAA